ncbi:hypothetical protein C2E23DRAFT_826913 [Lenzites betulinus]|nr:hypothetical protein C2E23DRAFT_826913 [Lenzites betulinus]
MMCITTNRSGNKLVHRPRTRTAHVPLPKPVVAARSQRVSREIMETRPGLQLASRNTTQTTTYQDVRPSGPGSSVIIPAHHRLGTRDARTARKYHSRTEARARCRSGLRSPRHAGRAHNSTGVAAMQSCTQPANYPPTYGYRYEYDAMHIISCPPARQHSGRKGKACPTPRPRQIPAAFERSKPGSHTAHRISQVRTPRTSSQIPTRTTASGAAPLSPDAPSLAFSRVRAASMTSTAQTALLSLPRQLRPTCSNRESYETGAGHAGGPDPVPLARSR